MPTLCQAELRTTKACSTAEAQRFLEEFKLQVHSFEPKGHVDGLESPLIASHLSHRIYILLS